LNKTWIIRAGLVFLILSFFIGFFWPVLFTPDGQNPQETATPAPSVFPAFTSSANATATVKKLDNRMILFCQGASEELSNGLKGELQAMPGVERVLTASGVFDVVLSANASSAASVAAVFTDACPTGIAYRRALELEFNSTVTFNPPAGFDPIVARLPSVLCKQANWNCLVFASTQENALISSVATLTRKQDGTEEGVIQEVAGFNALPSSSNNSTAANASNRSS